MDKNKGAKSRRTKKARSSDSPANEPHSPEPSSLSGVVGKRQRVRPNRGTGSGAAGQSGELQGLSRIPEADSQSVEELVEEGQFYEAEVISGIENAPGPDQGEVRTHEVPEDEDLS
jgi:hypothetical protein